MRMTHRITFAAVAFALFATRCEDDDEHVLPDASAAEIMNGVPFAAGRVR